MARGQVGLLLAALLLAALPDMSGLQRATRAEEPDSDEVMSRIAQLGSPKFSEREAATKALDGLGGKALPALRRAAAADPNAEVRRRAAGLVQAIEKRLMEERSFRSHEGCLFQVAFSPDGRVLFSGGYEVQRPEQFGRLRVWDLPGCKQLRELSSKGITYCFAVTADGKRVVTGAQHGDLCLWDPQTGQALRRFAAADLNVMALAISPAGRQLLSASNKFDKLDRLQLWDMESGNEIRSFGESTKQTYAVAFLPDGQTALSAGLDPVIRLWDVTTGRETRRFEGHTSAVIRLSVSPDGRLALSASRDRTIRLWDLKEGREIRRFLGHLDSVQAVKFMPDGRRAISASHDGTVRLWKIETGDELRKFEGQERLADVAISPDGKWVVSGSMQGNLRLWRLPE